MEDRLRDMLPDPAVLSYFGRDEAASPADGVVQDARDRRAGDPRPGAGAAAEARGRRPPRARRPSSRPPPSRRRRCPIERITVHAVNASRATHNSTTNQLSRESPNHAYQRRFPLSANRSPKRSCCGGRRTTASTSPATNRWPNWKPTRPTSISRPPPPASSASQEDRATREGRRSRRPNDRGRRQRPRRRPPSTAAPAAPGDGNAAATSAAPARNQPASKSPQTIFAPSVRRIVGENKLDPAARSPAPVPAGGSPRKTSHDGTARPRRPPPAHGRAVRRRPRRPSPRPPPRPRRPVAGRQRAARPPIRLRRHRASSASR